MIIPDVNLLIYAHDSSSPFHARARAWWEAALSHPMPVGVPWIVVLAFVRLMTHPTVNDNPMTVAAARKAVGTWFGQDHVRLLSPSEKTMHVFFDLLEGAGIGGNLSTDAMIAALAVEYGGCVYSNDLDFGRFRDLSWKNPLE
jgi:uncharacterized protein